MSKKKKVSAPPPAAGGAGWLATFADLMALLMCFFVMLLAMAEVDKAKFEELGRSMKVALGSPINSPAHTSNDIKPIPSTEQAGQTKKSEKVDAAMKVQQTKQDAEKIEELLKEQIAQNDVEVESHGRLIIIRMLESGAFESGSAKLKDDFRPVLDKIGEELNGIEGDIVVSGHADDIPIETDQYRSNWELSAARAYSVIEQFVDTDKIPANRFVLRGFGESRPLLPNTSSENRAKKPPR